MYRSLKKYYKYLLIIVTIAIAINIIKQLFNPFSILIIILISIIVYGKNKRIIKKFIYKIFFDNKSIKIKNKFIAAKKSLKSISELKNLIHNKVNSQIIYYEKSRLEKQLKTSDYNVILFGAGSCGKTSIVRALLKSIVGKISAGHGTTKEIKSYKINIPILKRNINIIDTPGLFEASKEGEDRETETLKRVSKSDLIIFVLDQDLNKYELYLIKELFNIGKSLIIVLNKCDLRSKNQNNLIKKNIIEKISTFSNKFQIIETVASPQSIPNTGTKAIKANPDVEQLFKKIIYLLEKSGEELLADNILLQCNKLGSVSKSLINEQRNNASKKLINKYSWITSGVILITPLPAIDILATSAINIQMILEISKIYGVKLSKEKASELMKAILTSLTALGVVKGGMSAIVNILNTNFTTKFISKSVQSITAAWVIRIVGLSFIKYFNQDQDWGDGGIQSVVEEIYELNRKEEIMKNFINEAIQKLKRKDSDLISKRLPPYYQSDQK